MTDPTISFTLGRRLGMVVYITEKSLWAGPTRGLWFFVRGACGRDPPGGRSAWKKMSCTTLQDLGRVIPYTHKWSEDLVGDTLDTPITPELLWWRSIPTPRPSALLNRYSDPRSQGADRLITSEPTCDQGSVPGSDTNSGCQVSNPTCFYWCKSQEDL